MLVFPVSHGKIYSVVLGANSHREGSVFDIHAQINLAGVRKNCRGNIELE